jgi:hypothetical protein
MTSADFWQPSATLLEKFDISGRPTTYATQRVVRRLTALLPSTMLFAIMNNNVELARYVDRRGAKDHW